MTWLDIRPCTDDDVTEVVSLWQRSFPDYPDPPADQLALARRQPNCAVFVAREGAALAGTAMAGCDGIRGWLHYVAVVPARRRRGVARALVRHAETWLAARGVGKVKLQVVAAGDEARLAYAALGYAEETHTTMGRRIAGTGAAPLAPTREREPGCLEVVVTHLEMKAPPPAPAPKAPAMRLAVLRADRISIPFYRFLYNEVGREWIWYERRAMDDADLAMALHDEAVDVFVAYVAGQPAGFVELDRRPHPREIEIRYFGLMPDFIGHGLGGWFLDWAVREGWRHAPQRLYVNTCSLDHPRALALYQKVGFVPVKQETRIVRDPRPLP